MKHATPTLSHAQKQTNTQTHTSKHKSVKYQREPTGTFNCVTKRIHREFCNYNNNIGLWKDGVRNVKKPVLNV